MNLQEILRKHQQWLRGEDGGERADLRGADLRGLDLRGVDLRRADLRGADLRRANLRDADLRGANLRRANLSNADLRRADLRGANLREVGWRGADLRGVGLRGVGLVGADLRRADLRRANLRGANLSNADLRGVDMRGADMRGVDLRRADLRRADLRGADLHGADLRYTCLDEDSSVSKWLKIQGLKGRGRGVIAYRTKKSLFTGQVYAVGKTYRAPYFSTDTTAPCHPGLYVAGLEWLRENYPDEPLIKVYFRLVDGPIVAGNKGRVRAFRVLCDVDETLCNS